MLDAARHAQLAGNNGKRYLNVKLWRLNGHVRRPFCVERITIYVIVAIISPNLLSPLHWTACTLIMGMLLAIDQHECAQSSRVSPARSPAYFLSALCLYNETEDTINAIAFAIAICMPFCQTAICSHIQTHNNNNEFDENYISYHFMPYVSVG